MSADSSNLILLVGPPNAGKTTFFNALTGSSTHPVNYPGATVEYAVGTAKKTLHAEVQFADTPGTYSLAPKSPEERITYDLLFTDKTRIPRAVLIILDGTQLSRHLPLARQVLETGHPAVLAITMKDLLTKDGLTLDTQALSLKMGAPVYSVQSSNPADLLKVTQAVTALAKSPQRPTHSPKPWSEARQSQELRWAAEIAAEVVKKDPAISPSVARATRRIDRLALHPVGGLFLFAAIMSVLFTSIFWLAAPLMDSITAFFDFAAKWVLTLAPGSLWADFLSGGVVQSIGAVLTFVPQIMILFLGITVLEDSGYLARAATLIDRPLTRLGLNGRSFVPLLSGYACAIPAMLAARTIPNKKERWITLFVIPLMSCSARLPVYSLLLAFLFWDQPAWKPGVALAAIYLLSLVVGSIAAALANRFLKAEGRSFFLLELPLYRKPSAPGVFKTVFLRTESYLRKAGVPIFVFATLLWSATTFPHYDAPDPGTRLQDSYAAKLGKVMNPLMQPMGGDWRTGVALISAFAAREVFVGSLALVLQISEEDEAKQRVSLLDSMQLATREDGSKLFTASSIVGLILFFMIALQCMSTVAVARREFGGWKYPLIQLVGFNVIAYILAVAAVQSLRALGIT